MTSSRSAVVAIPASHCAPIVLPVVCICIPCSVAAARWGLASPLAPCCPAAARWAPSLLLPLAMPLVPVVREYLIRYHKVRYRNVHTLYVAVISIIVTNQTPRPNGRQRPSKGCPEGMAQRATAAQQVVPRGDGMVPWPKWEKRI
jgi:hypothetical protein